MIYKNFSKYDIDVENQVVFSNCFNKKRYLQLSETKDGYIRCGVTDDKGNKYYRLHQIIFCAVNGITKDEFPHDENGVVYEIDHIDNNKKNNAPSNLRLVSKKDQMNNSITLKTLKRVTAQRMSSAEERERISLSLRNRADESKPVEQIDVITNEVVAVYPSIMEASRQSGISIASISRDCTRARRVNNYKRKWKFAFC